MEVLIVEDECAIAGSLKKNFLNAGHHAIVVTDGEAALSTIRNIQYDVILLDWKMPKMTGLQLCKKMKEAGLKTPIILLTALSEISNKVEALNAGADDYITKPFSFEEVLARINAVLRRYQSSVSALPFGDYSLDLIERTVISTEGKIRLSEKEFDLLRYFLLNRGSIVSKEQLCEKVWNIACNPETNFVEVTIKNLRKKLETGLKKKFIRTMYGEGYIFFAD